MTKIRKIFKWADRGKHWTSKQTRSANSISVLAFRTTHTILFYYYYYFFAERITRFPKYNRFSHTLLVTITRLLFCLWTDPLWSWCYSSEKFNCRGWCVVLSTVHKMFGWLKFPQPSEWMNFPHVTLMKWWQNHFDVIMIFIIWRKIIDRRRKSRRKQWL